MDTPRSLLLSWPWPVWSCVVAWIRSRASFSRHTSVAGHEWVNTSSRSGPIIFLLLWSAKWFRVAARQLRSRPTAMATSTKPSCQSLSSSTMNNPSKLDSRSPLSPGKPTRSVYNCFNFRCTVLKLELNLFTFNSGRLSPSRVPSVWSNLSRLTSRVFEMDQSEIGVVADSDILKLY